MPGRPERGMLGGMLNKLSFVVVVATLAVPAVGLAQDPAKPAPPPITASAGLKNLHTTVRGYIIARRRSDARGALRVQADARGPVVR